MTFTLSRRIRTGALVAAGSAALLFTPMAMAPASAATPGSECELTVQFVGVTTVLGGTVDAAGTHCQPDTPYEVLAGADFGVDILDGIFDGVVGLIPDPVECGTQVVVQPVAAAAACPN